MKTSYTPIQSVTKQVSMTCSLFITFFLHQTVSSIIPKFALIQARVYSGRLLYLVSIS